MATTVAPSSPTDNISYDDLYAKWERGNWRAMEIDFTQDKIDWDTKLTDEQRRSALWLYTLFFHGEDSVTDNLSPYIDAAPLEEQKYFLTTQQVDEARHAVFFNRFMHEVVGRGDGSIAGGLKATEDQITWGHRKVFTRLDQTADELRADRSPAQFARAITMYHIIVEASLAQPGQHMIENYLEEYDLLPGFREGMRNIALDELRHIAFGVKVLTDMYREDPTTTQAAILDVLDETIAWTTAVAKPPGWDLSYTEAFGFSLDDLGEEGARSLEQKLRTIGMPVDTIARFPMPMDLPPRERSRRGRVMLKANFIGEETPVVHDPEAVEILFDTMRRRADGNAASAGTTIEWDFTDSDPWHLTLDNGSTRATKGHAPNADLTLRLSLDDWGDVVSQRADAKRLLVKRRIKPRGDLRLLLKLQKILG